ERAPRREGRALQATEPAVADGGEGRGVHGGGGSGGGDGCGSADGGAARASGQGSSSGSGGSGEVGDLRFLSARKESSPGVPAVTDARGPDSGECDAPVCR